MVRWVVRWCGGRCGGAVKRRYGKAAYNLLLDRTGLVRRARLLEPREPKLPQLGDLSGLNVNVALVGDPTKRGGD